MFVNLILFLLLPTLFIPYLLLNDRRKKDVVLYGALSI